MSFKAVQQNIESKEGYSANTAAKIAYSIGKNKYGAKGMAQRAAAAKRKASGK